MSAIQRLIQSGPYQLQQPIRGSLHCPFGFAQGPVEMTMLCWCEEQATTEARLLGERVERGAGVGGVAGPSTASLRLALLAQGLRSG